MSYSTNHIFIDSEYDLQTLDGRGGYASSQFIFTLRSGRCMAGLWA